KRCGQWVSWIGRRTCFYRRSRKAGCMLVPPRPRSRMSLLARAILVGVLTAAALPSEPAAQAPKHILILYDENKDDLPGLARTDRSLRETFQAGLGKVEIYSESMGLSRSGLPGYDSLLTAYYRSKYAGLRFDLIVAVMEP